MTKEELQKEAEDFIIDRYKIAECYREDNAETREYMRIDVHSQYEEEYQLYLDVIIKEHEKENAELKEFIKNIIRVTWGEGWNYNLDWKVKAEQFLNSEVGK